MTFITVCLQVSCLLRFTPAANLVAHTLQFGDDGLILCWSRIRKSVTHREHTDREFNYRGHSNPRLIIGLSGPTVIGKKGGFIYKDYDV